MFLNCNANRAESDCFCGFSQGVRGSSKGPAYSGLRVFSAEVTVSPAAFIPIAPLVTKETENAMWGASDERKLLRVVDFGPQKGRGIVSLQDIKAGELIERSPVLLVPHRDRSSVDPTIIFTYVFMWEHGTCEEDLYKHEGRAAIALGFTSLLNHSYNPNAVFHRHIDEMMIDILAARDIEAGDEITIDYQMTLWFDPN